MAAAVLWPVAHAGTALIVATEAGPPDAIIMLASHEWERLPAAAALARQHPGAIVLLTTPPIITVLNCHRCSERVDWFEAEGIERRRIRLLRGRAGSTYGEALAAKAHVAREPFTRLTIVTSPYHTRRALATFRTVFGDTGIRISVLPASPAAGTPTRWWTDPYDRWYVSYEWAAILNYRYHYGVPLRRSGSAAE